MAVTYGFYDSLNHDRLYNAQQMSAIFDGIINDGVFMSVGNQFHTVAGTGMQVIVKSGRAWFDSTWTLNDAEYPLSIDAADVLLTRIDAVVLEVNSEVATRANTIKVVKGTPASTPAKPTLTNTATIHQHALAYVTVAKNITAITNSMIEIVVGKTETPYVTAILQTTDITDLYNQWEDYFQTWFDTVRGTLDGDVALNLQNQITTLRRETLKNTTPPIIGLPASATPDDMFQALGNTGELHVWRKTVKNAADVPAGYTLGEVQNVTKYPITDVRSYSSNIVVKAYSNVKVEDSGNVTVDESNYVNFYEDSSCTTMLGKFVQVHSRDPILFIPSDASVTFESKQVGSAFVQNYYTNKYQDVTGYAKIPAGTTTTYPVSTNPNAYQEGSDAKPAGYTLGEVKTGKHILSYQHSDLNEIHWEYSSKITVSDDGTVSLVSPRSENIDGGSYTSVAEKLIGKFARPTEDHSGFTTNVIVFFPSDATVTRDTTYGYNAMTISKYQPVTGYAAIPAGTTIEYLGKLGDKARVQVVSYVGTGTYGKDHPNSLTFNFVPKIVMIRCGEDSTLFDAIYDMRYVSIDSSYSQYVTVKWSKKTLSWYSPDAEKNQMNYAEYKYYAIAIG